MNFSQKRIAKFKRSLYNENWVIVYSIINAQNAFTVFQGMIDRHFKEHFKEETFTMNYKNRHPWMTQALRNSIQTKNNLY